MVSCEYCGDSTGGLAYVCNYCMTAFCPSHRLPEVHDCRNISQASPPNRSSVVDLRGYRERAKRENQPYSIVEVEETVGNTPEPDLASSPDVAIDGSIATEDNLNEPAPNGEEAISSNQIIVLVLIIVIVLMWIGIMYL